MKTLLEHARRHNRKLDITGCLILSRGRFAQIIEGDQTAVELLMESISRDPRHRDVQILHQLDIAERRFAGWDMAYAGASQLVCGTIVKAEAVGPNELSNDAELLRLMRAFRSGQEMPAG